MPINNSRRLSRPIVLEPCHAHHVLQFCIHHPSPHKHLIVCSTRDAFLQTLLHEIANTDPSALDLLAPILTNLHNSRNVQVTFCPDLGNLRAYLTASKHRPRPENSISALEEMHHQPDALLLIMNPIRLHEQTISYSAQGFNRTFASVVDTAHHLGRQLIMVECTNQQDEYETSFRQDEDMLDGQNPIANPWDRHVSMLNITTRTFGTGEQGWVGRTVKIRHIARRWCVFRKMDEGGNILL